MKSVNGLVYLTPDEMRGIDAEAITELGIDVLSLMENAGSQTARLAKRMLGGGVGGKRVVCLVGKGNNGGDGLVAARHLHNWGADVRIALGGSRSEFRDVPAKQLTILENMGLQVTEENADFPGSVLVIDALLGYSSRGDPRGAVAKLIRLANSSGIQVLGLDIPSGLDPATGTPNEPCIVAKTTITLGFPKTGFLNPLSRPYVGELYLCDISLPREIYKRYPEMERLFETDSIIRVALRD